MRADVALGPDGRSRGFGTVLFANDVDAAAAVAMYNGCVKIDISMLVESNQVPDMNIMAVRSKFTMTNSARVGIHLC